MKSKSEIFDKIASVKHILEVSYPQVKDSRLLVRCMVILSEAYSSVASSVGAHGDLEGLGSVHFSVFEGFLAKRDSLKSMIENYDCGPKSFSRPSDYVICAKDYKVQVISVSSVREYLTFLQENCEILRSCE